MYFWLAVWEGMLTYPSVHTAEARSQEEITAVLASRLLASSRGLPEDAVRELRKIRSHSSGPARLVMDAIMENLDKSEALSVPLCQDTGMGWFLVRKPPSLDLEPRVIVHEALARATKEGFLRSSVVEHPLRRKNPGTNLPAVVHEETHDGPLEIWHYLRGFGSENAGAAWLLRPTSTMDDIVHLICTRIDEIGGGACPPVFLGIGMGGTLEVAALLAKKALFREVGIHSSQPEDQKLEKMVLTAVNRLPVGPGGVGDGITAAWVAVESHPTHIAGLPVVLAVSCWADRRGITVFPEVKS